MFGSQALPGPGGAASALAQTLVAIGGGVLLLRGRKRKGDGNG